MTTKDAVILHTQEGQDDRFFTGAYRIIHGPGVRMTKKTIYYSLQERK